MLPLDWLMSPGPMYVLELQLLVIGQCMIFLSHVVPVLDHHPHHPLSFVVFTAFTFNSDGRNVEVWVPVGIVLCNIVLIEDHTMRKVISECCVCQDLLLDAIQGIGFDTAHQVLGLAAFVYTCMPMLHETFQNRVLLLVDGDIAFEIPAPSLTTICRIHEHLFHLRRHIIDIVWAQVMIY